MSEAIENLPQEKLESLGQYAARARELTTWMEEVNVKVQAAAEELREILEKKMPDILMEIGIDEIKLSTGERLKVATFYSASLSDENPLKEEAFKWLRANGHDSIIKNTVNGTFGKGQEKQADEAFKLLAEKYPTIFSKKSGVHPMTLKSFVKELCEAGTPPPAEPFKLFIGKKVTIK